MDNPISFPRLGFTVNPSRVAFSIFGLDIYWYGIIIATGFALAVFYALYRIRQEGIDEDKFFDVLIITTPAALICTRLYYVIFEWKQYHSLWEVLDVRDGGLAIYGGIIGAFVVGTLAVRWKKLPLFKILDIAGLSFMIGQCIGRWGNFFNREAHGGPTDLPWGMEVNTPEGRMTVHPTFFYESVWNLVGFLLINRYYKHKKFDGELFLMYVAWYGLGRFFIEGMRTDSLYFFGTGLRISQVLAGLSCIVALVLIAYFRYRVKNRPAADTAAQDISPEELADRMEVIDSQTELMLDDDADVRRVEEKEKEQTKNGHESNGQDIP